VNAATQLSGENAPIAADSPKFLRVTDVRKSFGGVAALKSVSLTVRAGVVHGLVGANGAGKSTFIRCLAGIEKPDDGTIEVDGEVVSIASPEDATHLGLAFIHQEMSLIPGWDVLRNMALGNAPKTHAGLIDWRPARARARSVAERLGMQFPLTTNVDSLSTADQWLILIGRALMEDARLIAMDEPTASLSVNEARRVHTIIRELAAAGTAVVFVSHRLDEVSHLCEDITVFKDGEVVRQIVGERATKPELVRAIVGRDLEVPERGSEPHPVGRPVLEVRKVTDGGRLRDVSLTVHASEILGLGGLVGAGRTELANVIYGATPRKSGEVLLEGRQVHFRDPASAVKAGIGLVPEERRTGGVFLDQSIDFNINLAKLDSLTPSPFWPYLNLRKARKRAQEVADLVTIKARNVASTVGSLSGGNQQKVVIARWLIDQPKVLILDEPSRGVDVGARAETYRVIKELAARGTAVLVISSDNEELVTICNRVEVMVEGRIVGELVGPEITEDRIVSLSFSGDEGKETER